MIALAPLAHSLAYTYNSSSNMGLFEDRLLLIESRLQVFVEGAADRLFPGARISERLAPRLMAAVRAGLRVDADGSLVAPEQLKLLVCPRELDLLRGRRWLGDLESALRTAGAEQGIRFPERPFLVVEGDARLAPGEVFAAPMDEMGISQTTDVAMPLETDYEVPAGGFLIVDGMRTFPLDQAVVNLGRRPDNQLVIDDARISRTHAQIRLAHKQFILFDLDSSGGTYVNGERITQKVLHPGDVISLAGVPIVFGQDFPELSETQELLTPFDGE